MEFFNKLAEDVEKLSSRFEEGLSVLLDGQLPNAKEQQGQEGPSSQEPSFEDLDLDGLTEEQIQQLIEQEMTERSPLEGIADSVLSDIVSRQVGPSTPMEHFHAFRSAITWSEPFILSLLAFQVFAFCMCLWVSKKNRGLSIRVSVMVAIGVIVRSAEWLNSWCADNWQSFCRQNYFDNKGIFVGIMLCGPLLLNCLMMLFMFVREASHLLVEVKREEFRRKKGRAPKSDSKRSKTNKIE